MEKAKEAATQAKQVTGGMSSNYTTISLIFMVVIISVGILMIGIIVYSEKQKAKAGRKLQHGLSIKTYSKLYKLFDQSFLTRGGFRKIVERLATLSIYSPDAVKINSVKFYGISLIFFWALTLSGFIIFKDMFTGLVVMLYALVVKDCVVFKKIDAIQFSILKQMRIALSAVRQNYLRFDNIPDSISESEVPPLLSNSFLEIYLILTSNDAEKRLDAFYATTPFRLLQTFAGVSYILNNTGDSKTESGTSNFIQALSMISTEIDCDIRKVTLMKSKFAMLEYLPLVPIFFMGVVEAFFAENIPGTSILYKGTYGYVVRVIIILASMFGYWTIVKINAVSSVKTDDRNPFIQKILKYKYVNKFVDDIMPKRSSRLAKKEKLLVGALSAKNLKQIYAMKALAALIVFLATIFICNTSVELGKSFTYQNVATLSLLGGENLTAHDVAVRRQVDAAYLALPNKPTQSQTEAVVKAKIPNLETLDQADQVERLMKKYDAYHGAYFKWWMMLLAFAFGAGGWFTPELVLKARKFMLKSESEEDILQLQTLIGILASTNLDTLDTLYWMQRHSRVHKNALIECYHGYPSGPLRALDDLKRKAPSAEFHRMVDKLSLTVYQISLGEAFSDLLTDREQMIRIRDISHTSSINKKRALASPIALLPLILVLILYILIPIGILGWQEFTRALASASK